MNSRMRSLQVAVGMLTILFLGCSKSPATLEQECSGTGRAASCVALGEMYVAGKGVTRDGDKAAMLFERACEARDAGGCDKARQIYQEGCDKGVAGACSLLGRMYLEGFGVPEDHARAAAIYQKACDLGHAVDCSNLAMMYAEGKGVAVDPAAAADLWRKACQGGFTDACKKVSNEAQQ